MEISFVEYSMASTFLFSYCYTYFSLGKDQRFIKDIVKSTSNNLDFEKYAGYIIVAEREIYINELSLFKKIYRKLGSEKKCLLLDISLDKSNTMFDLKVMEQLELVTIPAVLYSQNGKITEVVNFSGCDDNKILISKIMHFRGRKVKNNEHWNNIY